MSSAKLNGAVPFPRLFVSRSLYWLVPRNPMGVLLTDVNTVTRRALKLHCSRERKCMMASCECGTRPSVEPCVRLLEAYGSSRPCTLNKTAVEAGRACRALTTCDASPCLPAWMSSTAVRETLVASSRRNATWLLFVGDSDTRGLVLMLLQLLADAGYGPPRTAGYRGSRPVRSSPGNGR